MTPEEISKYIRLRCVQDGDCLRWYTKAKTVNRRRHPMFKVDGKPVLARRALYEAERGVLRPSYSLVPCCGDECCIEPSHQKQITTAQRCILGGKAAKDSPTRAANVRAARLEKGMLLLTPDLAREIRSADGTCVALAAHYGVSVKAISDCRLGKTWPEASPFAGLMA